MNCPSPEQLESLVDEQLSAAEQEAVSLHVADCPSCQRSLDELTGGSHSSHWLAAKAKSASGSAGTPFLQSLKSQVPRRSGVPAGTNDASFPTVPGYEILAELGRGGMGVVYKARQLRLNRLVALKMILSGSHAGQEHRARFRAEAEVIARLLHPNIVQIYEVGEQAGQPYFAIEFMEAGTLAARLRGTPQPARAAAQLVEILSRAIHFAHDQGIVHRDLKPSNVLMLHSDRTDAVSLQADSAASLRYEPKITDFGLAKRLDDAVGQTRPGEMLGTPSYMAPEQVRAEPCADAFTTAPGPRTASGTTGSPTELGPATDVYALGAILYELLTGRPPFKAASAIDTVLQVLHEEPVPPNRLQPRVPRDLETICLKCLEKPPARRYRTAGDLAVDLRHFLNDEPIAARPPSSFDQFRKFARRRPALVVGFIGVVASLVVGVISTSLFAMREGGLRRSADESARAAQVAQQAAERQTYQARIAAAIAALRDHDVATATAQLNAAPERLRNWEWRHLHSRLDDSLAVIHPDTTVRFLLLPDAARYVMVDRNHRLLLRDSSSDELVATLAEDAAHLWCLVPIRNSVCLWYVTTNHDTQLIELPSDLPTGVANTLSQRPVPNFTGIAAVSQDGSKLAMRDGVSPPDANVFSVFNRAGSERLFHGVGHSDMINSLNFSPDGRRIVTASEDRTLRVWDMSAGTSAELRGHRDKIVTAAFSPDGSRVLSASADGTLRQWNAETGELLHILRGHRDAVMAAEYSPDGSWIVSGGKDTTVRLWRAADGEQAAVLVGHSGGILQVAVSGGQIASRSADGTIRMWERGDRADRYVLRGHTNYVYPVAFSPDGRWIASSGWDRTVRLWDATTHEAVRVLGPHKTQVFSLAFTPDGSQIVTGTHRDGMISVWQLARGELHSTIAAHEGSVSALAISPDGSLLASAEESLKLWDMATGRELVRVPRPPQPSYHTGPRAVKASLAFSPDGRLLADAAHCNVYLWDVAKLVEQQSYPHESSANDSAHDRPASSPPAVRVLRGHTAGVDSVSFSKDGRYLVSAGADQTIRIWNAASGELVSELRGHTDEIFTAIFHPDGSRIASGGRDRTIRLWEPESGDEVARLEGHTSYIYSLAFSPDGKTLVSGSGDYTLRVWRSER